MDPEKELEQNAQREVKEEEVRQSVITGYGFDPEADKERIDKAVKREMTLLGERNTAIGQKIKHRTDFEDYRSKNPPKTEQPPAKQPDGEDLDTKIAVALEKDRLDAMEYPEDIKNVIANVAKLNGISVRKAVSDPYVSAKIDAWKKQQEADEAAISRNNNSGGQASDSIDVIPEFDMSTPEGRKGYEDWKKKMIAQGH